MFLRIVTVLETVISWTSKDVNSDQVNIIIIPERVCGHVADESLLAYLSSERILKKFVSTVFVMLKICVCHSSGLHMRLLIRTHRSQEYRMVNRNIHELGNLE